MENPEQNLNEENNLQQNEEIANIGQFQVERSGPNDGFKSDLSENEPDTADEDKDTDDSEYAEEEVKYADGEGTQLNEAFEDDEDK